MLRLIRDVAGLIYPPQCLVCREPIETSHFCQTCESHLASLEAIPSCPLCAYPSGEGAECPNCDGKGVFPFEQIIALAPFRDPLKKLIHQMKYSRQWPLAEILADRLCAQKRVQQLLSESDLIIPIPLHWTKQLARSFNQSELIARRISRISGVQFANPLARIKNTQSQTKTRSKLQRLANLRDAFGLTNFRKIKNKRVIIVDDVTTSNATLQFAARTIHAAGPKSLVAIVLAVADPKRRDFTAI